MRKFLVLLLSLFLITSCSHKVEFNEANYEEVLFSEIEQKIKNKETFTYYVGSDTCSSCAEFNIDLENYFKNHNDDKIYYVDVLDNFVNGKPYSDYKTTLANIAYELYPLKEISNIEKSVLYTPTTFRVINGEYAFAYIGTMQESMMELAFHLEFNNINYNSLNYDETVNLLNGEEDFLFYLTKEGCPSCLEFKLKVNSFDKQENEIKLNYLDLTDDIINDNDKMLYLKTFINSNLGNPIDITNFELNVPTLIKKKNGVISISVGVPSRDELIKFFE